MKELKHLSTNAVMIEQDNCIGLYSYDTLVCCYKDGKIMRKWDGYSATTMRHISLFLKAVNHPDATMKKSRWLNLPLNEYVD